MDAYCLVRFNFLCLRICLFATFWGMLVLTPLYWKGTAGQSGIYVITLANVEPGSNTLVSFQLLRRNHDVSRDAHTWNRNRVSFHSIQVNMF